MRYLFAFLCLFASLQANDEVVVRLATTTQLHPLYIAKISSQDTEFDRAYLKKLETILRYDFDNNGSTQLLDQSSEKERWAEQTYNDPESYLSDWRSANVMYVIIPRVEANHLSLRLLSVSNHVIKDLNEIALSGDLKEDRHRVHQAADTIHRELFGADGIASTRILFTRRLPASADGKQISEVWEAGYDGAEPRQITHEKAYCVTPAYVPPAPGMVSRQMIYVTYRWGPPKVMLASLKDGDAQQILNIRGNQLLPAVSRQRNQIAFISDVSGNPDLFIQPFSPEQGAIGKPQQVFSARSATQGSPTFSPEGTRIAFVSDKAGSPQIYMMDIPSAGARLKDLHPTLVSTRARNGTAPSWSPDGTKIAFCSQTQGLRQLWIYDLVTKQEYQITNGPGNKENPSWAPNSLHLVYNTADVGNAELFLIDLHRQKPVKILAGTGEKRFPSWEPRVPKT